MFLFLLCKLLDHPKSKSIQPRSGSCFEDYFILRLAKLRQTDVVHNLPQMTLEAFPSERNYQHLGDVFNRPTLSELVDGKGGADTAKDPEKGDEDKASAISVFWAISFDI